MSKPVVVLGYGAVGRAVTRDLAKRGITMIVGQRHEPTQLPPEVRFVRVDLTVRESMLAAAAGAAAIICCAGFTYRAAVWEQACLVAEVSEFFGHLAISGKLAPSQRPHPACLVAMVAPAAAPRLPGGRAPSNEAIVEQCGKRERLIVVHHVAAIGNDFFAEFLLLSHQLLFEEY